MICEGYLKYHYTFCHNTKEIEGNAYSEYDYICPNSIPHEKDDWCKEGYGRGLCGSILDNICAKYKCVKEESYLEYTMKKIINKEKEKNYERDTEI